MCCEMVITKVEAPKFVVVIAVVLFITAFGLCMSKCEPPVYLYLVLACLCGYLLV